MINKQKTNMNTLKLNLDLDNSICKSVYIKEMHSMILEVCRDFEKVMIKSIFNRISIVKEQFPNINISVYIDHLLITYIYMKKRNELYSKKGNTEDAKTYELSLKIINEKIYTQFSVLNIRITNDVQTQHVMRLDIDYNNESKSRPRKKHKNLNY